jgi:hypothetical protein
LGDLTIDSHRLPGRQHLGLPFRQIGLHGEVCLREI